MLSIIYLAINAICIGLIGLAYLCDPNILLARYDLQADSVSMDSMLRSSYGGVFVVAAAIFALGIFNPARRRDSIAFTTVFMTACAIGRLASIILVGIPHSTILGLLGYEVIAATIGLILFLRSAKTA